MRRLSKVEASGVRHPTRLLPMAPAPCDYPWRRRWRRGIAALSACAILATAVPLIVDMPLRFLWNASPSVPRGLYLVRSGTPERGDLAVVRPAPDVARFMARRRYVPLGVPLLKPVAALAGARVCRDGLGVSVDGTTRAVALRADRLGRPLPAWTGCRRLGSGELFLLAPASPESFDSRYIGAVRASDMIGVAAPLWTLS